MNKPNHISDFGGNASADGNDGKNAAPDTAPDIVSDGFKAENICGEGASCIVYRMRLGGLLVAVKRLRTKFRFYPAYLASYRKEFMIGQRLKHDALPVYRELKTGPGDVYIIMDYVDGVPLEDFIKSQEGRQYFSSVENSRQFLVQLLNVVCYLHRSGVIHCDLKPANVMLRNSDRAVMLLDLDKAYCDILENTHGGTKGSSAPLQAGEKPTSAKDFTAIGSIFDKIADTIPAFKTSKFRKFRKECDNPEATTDILLKSLQPKSKSNLWMFLGAVAIVSALVITLLFTNSESQQPDDYVPTTDTIVSIINIPSQSDESASHKPQSSQAESSQAKSKDATSIPIDFDAEMVDFIAYARSEQKRLSSGSMTDSEISAMSLSLSDKYLTAYSEIVKSAKSSHPSIPGIDIEFTVAKASEKSKASALLKELSQAGVDTLKHRNPSLYQD